MFFSLVFNVDNNSLFIVMYTYTYVLVVAWSCASNMITSYLSGDSLNIYFLISFHFAGTDMIT